MLAHTGRTYSADACETLPKPSVSSVPPLEYQENSGARLVGLVGKLWHSLGRSNCGQQDVARSAACADVR